MISTADRMLNIGASATSSTTAKAKELRAAGHHIINFAAGELDVASPPSAVSAAGEAAAAEAFHHYGPPSGLLPLRETVAERLSRPANPLDASNVVVTGGTKQALFHAIMATVNPGDEVLLPTPYWTSYPAMIELAGGVAVEMEAGPERSFKIDTDMLDQALTPKTKLLVFVSPANPTGAVYTPSEAQAIGQWALEHGIVVLSDEIYDGLVYSPHVSVPITDLVPELAAQTLRAGGTGKTFAMTGWRVGWLVGPRELAAAATTLQSHSTSHPSNIAQAAALAVLHDGEAAWREDIHATLDRRRQLMLEGLRSIPGVTCVEPAGAFYAFPSMSSYLGTSIGGRHVDSSADIAEVLLEQAGLAVVPGEAFGMPGHIRLSYALGDADIKDGLTKLVDLLTNRSASTDE